MKHFIPLSVLDNVLNFPKVYGFYYNTHIRTVLTYSLPVTSTSYSSHLLMVGTFPNINASATAHKSITSIALITIIVTEVN